MNMKLYTLLLFLPLTLFAQNLPTGSWRFVLENAGGGIPFNAEILQKNQKFLLRIRNAEEVIDFEEVVVSEGKDSIFVPMNTFDACLALRLEGNQMSGAYKRHYNQTSQSLKAYFGEKYRFFTENKASQVDFSGKWQVTFTNTEGRTYPAIALFKHDTKTGKITGTFLTTTGDYRFLEGNVKENALYLSTFDGAFAFLFKASFENNELKGEFWSAMNKQASWIARRNENATLPDASKITYLKEGYDKIEFSFPDLSGKKVSLADEKYKNKVVILQIFGSWCPNCMDETAFLAEWYRKNKKKPVAIIGLAYERKPDFEYAKKMVEKVVKRFNVEYDFLIAGTNEKGVAEKTLPMLNGIFSYPTTIFIDKKGKVRKIHTGFAGPGTGEYYKTWRQEFNELMNTLLKE